jgi:predicted homoserine dehydrogenase-like protein
VITNADGDQPGVMMNLFRFVQTIGYKPVLVGNIKGLQDHYRTPETQKAFAEQHNITPQMATSFADGTKISMENAVVANATGFQVGQRGMYGPKCSHVREAVNLFPVEKMLETGLVDYILGAEPGPGVFVIGYNEDPERAGYMRYFKMGDGPLYVFYVPYHLPHLEVPLTAARAVLFHDAAVAPINEPICDVISVAKKDLKVGEVLDGIGGFTCYGVIENSSVSKNEGFLAMGLAEGCKTNCKIPKDSIIKLADITPPSGRLSIKLWNEQGKLFHR